MGSSSRRSEYGSVFVSEIVFFVFIFATVTAVVSVSVPFRSVPIPNNNAVSVPISMLVRFRFPATEPNRIASSRNGRRSFYTLPGAGGMGGPGPDGNAPSPEAPCAS